NPGESDRDRLGLNREWGGETCGGKAGINLRWHAERGESGGRRHLLPSCYEWHVRTLPSSELFA
ncbi:MAG: hypothetical protein EBT17_03950, partial [Actinobacteria bacterium]|nr:hypothetical protein [Actinomycetota bacterium]